MIFSRLFFVFFLYVIYYYVLYVYYFEYCGSKIKLMVKIWFLFFIYNLIEKINKYKIGLVDVIEL